ncbi:SCO2525 family SAM-dependent methyltransferase [Streptomyces sp. TE5632]
MNAEARWEKFDPTLYVQENYSRLLSVDETIISIIRAHFSNHFRDISEPLIHGIDVGAGANLYPALSMLPWCARITLLDRSKSNLDYLQQQMDGHDDGWEKFWRKLCLDDAYASVPGGPWARLREVAQIEQGDILNPVDRRLRWQMGTMFFVAESVSTSTREFHCAVEHFLEKLTPGAPFAAAFMEHSDGYRLGRTWFPACDVSQADIDASIRRFTDSVQTYRIGKPGEVRPGYTSIILACGFR